MTQGKEKIPAAFVNRSRLWNGAFLVVFLAFFLVGYNTATSGVNRCSAQIAAVLDLAGIPVPPVFAAIGGSCAPFGCDCTGCPSPAPCELPGTADTVRYFLEYSLKFALIAASATLEVYMGTLIDGMVQAALLSINMTEWNIIRWWDTFWYYNFKPALQDMTDQMNTATAEQARAIGGAIDGFQQSRTQLAQQAEELQAHRDFRVSTSVCVPATQAGGYGRVTTFSRSMRQAWQGEALQQGLNYKGVIGDDGIGEVYEIDSKEYASIFCDPSSNGGVNSCVPKIAGAFYNADTQAVKMLYNQLTIRFNNDHRNAPAASQLLMNMIGTPAANPIPKKAMASPAGQEEWLGRRSFLARHGAVRSVPQIIMGWRVSGSQMGQWVRQLRLKAGIPWANISDNPSYREIVHAVSVDRFNSGRYATDLIADESVVEMEKLTLNAFYLMQLRDYYELLERMALTLAVQVSLTVDNTPVPDISRLAPLK